MKRAFVLLSAAFAFGACTLDKQTAPSLAGPSELGLSLSMTASPDVIMQDGQSQSTIQVTARDVNGQPIRGLFLRANITIDGTQVDFGTLSVRTLSTDSAGHATVVYTAPPTPPPTVTSDTVVRVTVTPQGTDFTNDFSRFVSILVARPGTVVPPGSSDISPSFSSTPNNPSVGQAVVFNSTSTIKAGSPRKIMSYAWNFGDGGTGNGATVSHPYQKLGNFAVTMTVTDDLGGTSTVSGSVSVGGNPPKADIVVSPQTALVGDTVVFSGLTSTAGEGRTITGYSWSFGDGFNGSGDTAQHAYGAAGTYTVVLTVFDDFGQTASASKAVTVQDILAKFTFSPESPTTAQAVSFNASSSKVGAGRTIVSYTWDFGDGSAPTTTAGPNTSKGPYTIVGAYTVTLTIRDDQGHTGSSSQTVTVK